MKNISILFCAFLLATTTLVGCDNSGDDDINKPTTCYFGGWIDLQKIPTITKETFKRQIVGKGWKHVFTQEMNANGTIEQKATTKGSSESILSTSISLRAASQASFIQMLLTRMLRPQRTISTTKQPTLFS